MDTPHERRTKARDFARWMIENKRKSRVRRGYECPICGREDWCLRTPDGSAALCRRSDGTHSLGRWGNFGHLHLLGGHTLPAIQEHPKEKLELDSDRHLRLAPRVTKWARAAYSAGLLETLSEELGVSSHALEELEVGWDGLAWTTPERNAVGQIVGVQRRFRSGTKRMLKGSRRALTFAHPDWLTRRGPILVVEGGSDVAAGLTLGLAVVGRPSNSGGLLELITLVRDLDRPVIVVAERDRKEDGRWPGREGSQSIADGLRRNIGRGRVHVRLMPGAKDLRGWLQHSGLPKNAGPACVRAGRALCLDLLDSMTWT